MFARLCRFSCHQVAIPAQKWYLKKIQLSILKILIIGDLYYVIRNPGQCHSIK